MIVDYDPQWALFDAAILDRVERNAGQPLAADELFAAMRERYAEAFDRDAADAHRR